MLADDEQAAGGEGYSCDGEGSDQCCEPVERGRVTPVHLDHDGRFGGAGVDRVWERAAVGSAAPTVASAGDPGWSGRLVIGACGGCRRDVGAVGEVPGGSL